MIGFILLTVASEVAADPGQGPDLTSGEVHRCAGSPMSWNATCRASWEEEDDPVQGL